MTESDPKRLPVTYVMDDQVGMSARRARSSDRPRKDVRSAGAVKEDNPLRQTANSTAAGKAVDSRALVTSSRNSSELTIEALYLSGGAPASHSRTRDTDSRGGRADDEIPDEGERARMISDLTRLIREPHMPEPTRCAGLTLIGWLARRMPGEAAHSIGVAEARQSERRLRAAQRKSR